MKKKLIKTDDSLYYFKFNGRWEGAHPLLLGNCNGLRGNCSGLRGDCSELRGNCSDLRGDCSKLYGDCTDLTGNLDDCEVTEFTNIKELVQ